MYGDFCALSSRPSPLPPDRRVRLVTESGKTIRRTSESNAERMRAALEPRHGPLTVVPT